MGDEAQRLIALLNAAEAQAPGLLFEACDLCYVTHFP